MNSQQQHCLVLFGSILLLVSSNDVTAFSISSSQRSCAKFFSRQKTSRCANVLYATGAAEGYLDSLSSFVEPSMPRGSVTDLYLESLSRIADLSPAYTSYPTPVTPEEYLTNLPQQIAEATAVSITEPNFNSAASNAGMYLADATVGVADGSSSTFGAVVDAVVPTTPSTLSSTITTTADSLSSQLSGYSYDAVIQSEPKWQSAAAATTSNPGLPLNKIGSLLGSGDTSALDKISQSSLEDLSSDVAGGIKLMGNSLGQVLTAVDGTLQDNVGLTLSGTTSSVVERAQISIAAVVNSATASITETIQHKIHDIGSMTVTEVLQNLVTLLIVVSKLLFSILNTIVSLLSGKGMTEWAVATTGAIEQKAAALSMQAATAASDLTHKSLMDLTNSIAHYSQDVADGVTTMAVNSIDGVSVAVATAHLL